MTEVEPAIRRKRRHCHQKYADRKADGCFDAGFSDSVFKHAPAVCYAYGDTIAGIGTAGGVKTVLSFAESDS